MKKINLIFALVFVLMFTINAGDIYDADNIELLKSRWVDLRWMMYGIIAVVLCAGIAGIVYSFGYILDARNLKAWAISEGLNAVASAIMIILLILLLQQAFSFITDDLLTTNTVTCAGGDYPASEPINFAKCRVEEQIIVLDDLYDQIYVTNTVWEKQASRCFSFMGYTVWCGDWYGNTRKQIESGYMLTNKIIPLTVGLHSVYVMLEYISANMLIVFLPLGILLRTFPITRGVGGLLIALAIGAYFIFPVLYIMLDPSFTTRPAGVDPPFLDNAYGCYPGFKGGVSLANIVNSQETYEYTIFSYQRIGDILVEITIRSIYYPFVAFSATVILIMAMTPILGGDTGDMIRLISKSV
ncbi:hypothetical protein KO317_00525 [Candidatus Micrarchaeota archaeon]|nr:hypothetical protein [Candidatus Micrarchaeota archaeon]